MNETNKQQKRNQLLILLVVSLCIVPFVLAWIYTKNPEWLSGRTNIGELILPPVTTERNELFGYDQFSIENIDQLKGHWLMVNSIPGKDCSNQCREAIKKTRQLRLMMNKDLTRIRRVVVIFDEIDINQVGDWWQQDDRLLKVKPSASFRAKINQITSGQPNEGMLLLMDPFGNLMMIYEAGFDPYDVKKDLKKLLRISQIG